MYFVTSLAFVAAALPQGTGEPQHVRHADTIPPDALAVVSTGAWDDHRQLMTTSGLDQVLIEPSGMVSRLRRAALLRIVGSGAAELAELEDLGTLGFTVAVMPDSGPDRPAEVLVILDVTEDDGKALRTALNRRAGNAEEVLRQDLAGTSAFQLRNVPGQPAIAVLENELLIATTTDGLAAAIARARGRATDSLAGTERFQLFAEQVEGLGTGTPWLAMYVDVEASWKLGLSQIPRPERDQIASWIDHIGVGAIGAFGVMVGEVEGEIHESVVVTAPAPLPPIFAALFPDTPVETRDLAALVSSDATAFGIGQVRWHDTFVAILDVLERGQPEFAAQARGLLQAAGGQLGGIDIEYDLLEPLGARVVSMSWPSQLAGVPESLVLVELAIPDRMKATLGRMPMFEESKLGDFDLFLPPETGGGVLAIGGGNLVFASSERRLRRWINERRTGTSNPLVAQALRTLPEGSTGFGVLDLGSAAADALANLDAAAGMLPPEAQMARRIVTETTNGMGPLHYSTRTDARGMTFVARSTSGSVTRLFAAVASALTGTLEQDPMLASMLDQAQSADRSQDARKLVAMDAIRTAQDHFRDEHGSFADLDQLIQQNLLRSDLFDERVSDGVFAIGDSLLTVLVSESQDTPRFVAVAWPNDERPGEVLACSDDRAPQRNELLARVTGLAMPETTDLFVGGEFGGSWTPGWRSVGEETKAAVRDGSRSGNTATFQVLTALERQGEAGARELVGYLDHENALIVARACWSLGRLEHAPAVPKLIELLENHEDVEVRRHAMGALAAMSDPRTAQASVRALSDPDGTVRTLAASNVGKLKFDGAKDGLVSVLTAPEEPVEEDVDAVTAILALRDLSDPTQLLPAATAFEREGRKAQEALAWMFQELSPKLETEEAKVLMAVLDHRSDLLRRFAIQRLGELADPKTASALEARLAQENDELRPLVEVSLAAVRGASGDGAGDLGSTLAARGRQLLDRAKAIWANPEQRQYVLAGGGGFVLLLFLISIGLRRRRRRREADAWAERVRPSEGFEEHEDVYDEYDEGDDQGWDETAEGEEVEWQTDGPARS